LSINESIGRASAALSNYNGAESDLRDLLSDLMHYAAAQGMDFDDELRIARDNFDAERAEENGGDK
jgi:hypothetical protein